MARQSRKNNRNEMYVKDTFYELNSIKQWKMEGDYNKRNGLLHKDESIDEVNDDFTLIVDQVHDETGLMTLNGETKRVYENFLVPQQKYQFKTLQPRFNLRFNDIEDIIVVYVTRKDSVIIAKFSSNFYIHIYAQHIFANFVTKIYLVFITQQADLFFQIVSAYQEKKIFIIPPKYSNLQNLCNATIVKHNLAKHLLPTMLFQNCKNFEKILIFFFGYLEEFNKKGWSLRYELPFQFDFGTRLPKCIDSENGLICHFPRISRQDLFLFQQDKR